MCVVQGVKIAAIATTIILARRSNQICRTILPNERAVVIKEIIMASPASIARHPIHPMLIPFPIALWVFSLVADVIYLWRGNPAWRNWIAFYTLLGGIIGGAAAAVPGLV